MCAVFGEFAGNVERVVNVLAKAGVEITGDGGVRLSAGAV
jgi:hypothetical protein